MSIRYSWHSADLEAECWQCAHVGCDKRKSNTPSRHIIMWMVIRVVQIFRNSHRNITENMFVYWSLWNDEVGWVSVFFLKITYVFSGPLAGVPISGCVGDQQAALLGRNCLSKGDTKTTYGTGTFMLCNVGTKAIFSNFGLLSTIAYQLGANEKVCYALEGSGSIGGNVVSFFRDNFKLINVSEITRPC